MGQQYGSILLGKSQPWQKLARFPDTIIKDQLKLGWLFHLKKKTIFVLGKRKEASLLQTQES